MGRIWTFPYGTASYGVFFAVFVYAIGFIGGILTPARLDGVPRAPLVLALSVDLGLLVALLLYATFLIDHFDLFGLKQVWRRLGNKAYRAPAFRMPSLFKRVRHPLYIGWLTIFWAAPTMTVAHLIFALGTTGYILIAIRWEEADLAASFGPVYEDDRSRTPMLIPRLRIRYHAHITGELR